MQLTELRMLDVDASLVAKARRGDLGAFDELVRLHSRMAGRLALRLLGNREDAEDAVQDAFAKAWSHLADFRGDASFRTWVLHITANVAQDLLRKRGRRAGRADAELEEAVSELDSPRRTAEARDHLALLREAVDALPPRQRLALLLRIYEGLDYEDVAAVLGTTVNATRVYLALARQSLRRRFGTLFEGDAPRGGPAAGGQT